MASGGVSPNQQGQVQYAGNSPILGQQPSTQAPAGYSYDPVQNRYVSTVGSAADQQAQRQRAQTMQDTVCGQEQQAFAKSMQPLGGLSSAGAGGGYGGGQMPSAPQMPQFPSLQGIPSASQFMPAAVGAGTNDISVQMPDMSGAQQAAFNTAKNQQGKVTASALAGLQSSLAGRGLLGGGYEGKGTTDIVQQGAQALGDLSNQQAQTQAGQALDVAKTGYQGAIAQRGQNISAQQAAQQAALQAQQQQAQQALAAYSAQAGTAGNLYGQQLASYDTTRGQDVTQRGQDIQAQLEQERLRQQALQGLTSSFSASFGNRY